MDLKPQKPAEGIMQISNYPDLKIYQVECNCGNPDDSITFCVESDGSEVIVSTSTVQRTPWWNDPFKRNQSYQFENEFLYNLNYYVRGFLNGIAHRLSITWDVWVNGHVKYSQSTIMTAQQALNYSHTLKKAVHDVQNIQKS